jgi:hypothetical protein
MSEKMIPFSGVGKYRLANGQIVNLSPTKRCKTSDKIQSNTGLCLDWVWEDDGSITGLGPDSKIFYLVEKLPEVKFYVNKKGFLDSTAYIIRTGCLYQTVRKNGTMGLSSGWQKTNDQFVENGNWLEVTEDDARKLLDANASKEEVWPRYFVGKLWDKDDAYIRHDSPTSSVWVNRMGKESPRHSNDSPTKEHIALAQWEEVTKEDALKRVVGTSAKPVKPDTNVKGDFMFIKKEEVAVEKETAVKIVTGVAKFAGKWGWRTVNYWGFQPVTEVATRILRAVRYVTLTGAIVGGVYAYNNPEKAADLFKSCLPKITIESPEIMKS